MPHPLRVFLMLIVFLVFLKIDLSLPPEGTLELLKASVARRTRIPMINVSSIFNSVSSSFDIDSLWIVYPKYLSISNKILSKPFYITFLFQLRVFETYRGKIQNLMSDNKQPLSRIGDNDTIIV